MEDGNCPSYHAAWLKPTILNLDKQYHEWCFFVTPIIFLHLQSKDVSPEHCVPILRYH